MRAAQAPEADEFPPHILRSFESLASGLVDRGWFVCDDWFRFQPELILRLRQDLMDLGHCGGLKIASVGRGQQQVIAPHIRRDRIAWVTGASQAQARLLEQLEGFRNYLNQHLFLGLRCHESQFAVYHPGDFYRRHVDSFRGTSTRLVSLVLYLNASWQPADGGELRLYPTDDSQSPLDIEPQGGRVVVFLSEEIAHEVLPVAAPRYSIASWYRGDKAL